MTEPVPVPSLEIQILIRSYFSRTVYFTENLEKHVHFEAKLQELEKKEQEKNQAEYFRFCQFHPRQGHFLHLKNPRRRTQCHHR